MPRWFQLKMFCPITGCPNNSIGAIFNWVCAKDKTTMFISEEGRLRCNSTYDQHNDLIMNWKFDCGDRTGPHRSTHFLSADYEGFNHALATAMLHSEYSSVEWAMTLMANLKKQYNRN